MLTLPAQARNAHSRKPGNPSEARRRASGVIGGKSSTSLPILLFLYILGSTLKGSWDVLCAFPVCSVMGVTKADRYSALPLPK